jgi:hypothetical protein
MDKISLKWATDDKTILLITYNVDGWTWEDSFKALDEQRALIESSPAPVVDVIVDATRSRWMPKGGSILSGIRKVSSSKHPRQGQTIFVGARGILASMADLMMKVLDVRRREFQFADNTERAYEMLAEVKAARQNIS